MSGTEVTSNKSAQSSGVTNTQSSSPTKSPNKEQQNASGQEPGAEVDLYEVLGLKHTASHSEVEMAFKKKASECYPSKNPKDDRATLQRKFNDVAYAYSILVDPVRRDDYDQIHHYRFSKQQALKQFDDFFKKHGVLPNEEQFFQRYYPNRRRTYYDVLGLPKNANEDLINETFRRKALQLHPRNHAGDKQKEEEFRELCEAYSHLSDRTKRRLYDKLEFQDVPSFQAYAQFNNYFEDEEQYENEEDKKVLGTFVRKTSMKQGMKLDKKPSDHSEEPHSVIEEVNSQTIQTKGPEGVVRTTRTTKTSVVDGKKKVVSFDETINPDGTVSVVETVEDGTGEPRVSKYTLPKDTRPALLQ